LSSSFSVYSLFVVFGPCRAHASISQRRALLQTKATMKGGPYKADRVEVGKRSGSALRSFPFPNVVKRIDDCPTARANNSRVCNGLKSWRIELVHRNSIFPLARRANFGASHEVNPLAPSSLFSLFPTSIELCRSQSRKNKVIYLINKGKIPELPGPPHSKHLTAHDELLCLRE